MGLLDPRRLRRMSSRLIACGSLLAMGAVGAWALRFPQLTPMW